MSRASLGDLLRERPWVLADGATGTNLFEMGLVSGDSPEMWNLEFPDRIIDLHNGFIDAGSDIILTNSFGGTSCRLKLHGAQDQVYALNKAAAVLGRRAADEASRPVVVAGSMGPTGEIFKPVGTLSHEEGVRVFADQAKGLADGGADVLWIETLSSEEEVRAAVEGAATVGLPLVVTLSFDTNGCTMMGVTPKRFGALTQELTPRPLAFGANCGTGISDLVASVLSILKEFPDAVVVAKGNCGIPEYHDGHIHYSGTPELMGDYARLAVDCGARIIGGCCGTSFEHVRQMSKALQGYTRGSVPSLEEVAARLGPLTQPSPGADPSGREPRPRRRRE